MSAVMQASRRVDHGVATLVAHSDRREALSQPSVRAGQPAAAGELRPVEAEPRRAEVLVQAVPSARDPQPARGKEALRRPAVHRPARRDHRAGQGCVPGQSSAGEGARPPMAAGQPRAPQRSRAGTTSTTAEAAQVLGTCSVDRCSERLTAACAREGWRPPSVHDQRSHRPRQRHLPALFAHRAAGREVATPVVGFDRPHHPAIQRRTAPPRQRPAGASDVQPAEGRTL